MATNNTPSAAASPPLQSIGNDLLSALGQKPASQPQQPQQSQAQQAQQQQQHHQQQVALQIPIPQQLPPQQPPFMQHPSMLPMMNQTPPNFTIPTSESADRAGNRLQELFDSTNQSMANLNMAEPPQRRAMANGELTKPFYPPFVNMSPAASPNNRNPGALLQALHGGLPPPPPSHSLPLPPQHQQQQQQQSVPMGMPLMPQQVMGLMRPEVGRRFGGGRPLLSKPEFIQQLLNMIQCDPTFFDILYENYKGQMGPPPPPPV
ncbi:hypothetical protein G6F42_021250 [Rhizopus arrhizus]|nr:hypothetical protein G6F42_021250 [Rhizopus arrhizus]